MLATTENTRPKSATALITMNTVDATTPTYDLDALTYRPPPRPEDLPRGVQLIGRRISVAWTDGGWFEAVAVCYYPKRDAHKLVYVEDGSLEVIQLHKGRWYLIEQEGPGRSARRLIGATITFVHPGDNRVRSAVVYNSDTEGKRLQVAYISEKKTDSLCGENWHLVKASPCFRRRGT